jgi:chorismate mutase
MTERLLLLLLWVAYLPVANACSSDEVFDLVAQRLSYMPAVARAKHALGVPVEDLAREAVVLQQSRAKAAAAGLPEAAVAELMIAQMSVAKAIQRRQPERRADTIDGLGLLAEIRPQLSALGQLQLQSLACLRQRQILLTPDQFALFSTHLEPQQLPPEEARLLFQRLQQLLAAP